MAAKAKKSEIPPARPVLFGQRHRKKGLFDISHSAALDQPLCDVENTYTQSNYLHSKENKIR